MRCSSTCLTPIVPTRFLQPPNESELPIHCWTYHNLVWTCQCQRRSLTLSDSVNTAWLPTGCGSGNYCLRRASLNVPIRQEGLKHTNSIHFGNFQSGTRCTIVCLHAWPALYCPKKQQISQLKQSLQQTNLAAVYYVVHWNFHVYTISTSL